MIPTLHHGKPENVVEHEHYFTTDDEEILAIDDMARFDACLLADGRACVYYPRAQEYVIVENYETAKREAKGLADGTRAMFNAMLARQGTDEPSH